MLRKNFFRLFCYKIAEIVLPIYQNDIKNIQCMKRIDNSEHFIRDIYAEINNISV